MVWNSVPQISGFGFLEVGVGGLVIVWLGYLRFAVLQAFVGLLIMIFGFVDLIVGFRGLRFAL